MNFGRLKSLKIWIGLTVLILGGKAESQTDCGGLLDPALRKRVRAELSNFYQDGIYTLNFEHQGFVYEGRLTPEHPRGVLNRYPRFNKKNVQAVLDIGHLAEQENKPWYLSDFICRGPHCLVILSHGGQDATEVREFDLRTMQFVEDGFHLPLGYHQVEWAGADSVFVATSEVGEKTKIGQARTLLKWHRGEKLQDAVILDRIDPESLFQNFHVMALNKQTMVINYHHRSHHHSRARVRFGEGKFRDIPLDASFLIEGAHGQHLILKLVLPWRQDDGQILPPGTIMSLSKRKLSTGSPQVLFKPTEHQNTGAVAINSQGIILTIHHADGLTFRTLKFHQGRVTEILENTVLEFANTQIVEAESEHREWTLSFEDAIHPQRLFLFSGSGFTPTGHSEEPDLSAAYVSERGTASGAQGKSVPYQILRRKGTPDGSPVLINLYGAFDFPEAMTYQREFLTQWLDHGGILVNAMIHGALERGWQASQDARGISDLGAQDLIAVTRKLIHDGVADERGVALSGASAAGRWIGLAVLRAPQLFRAVSCLNCIFNLVDLAEWGFDRTFTSEFGEATEKKTRRLLRAVSPVHAKGSPGIYPAVWLRGAENDDRVSPQHSRDFATRLEQLGANVQLRLQKDGGHSEQTSFHSQIEGLTEHWAFLRTQMGLNGN